MTGEKEFITVIVNSSKEEVKDYNRFISILKETLELLIEKMNNYNSMKEKSEVDALTGLKNRQAYNIDIERIKDDEKITFTLLDLFRLKYINDNINHFTGDYYIKKSASILKCFFPSKKIINGVEKETGDKVYRVGGDEFIIISKNKTVSQVENILRYILIYIERINLNTDGDIIKGINYGVVSRDNNESIEDLYKKADRKMSEDKKKLYMKYGIDRRK